MTSTCYTEGVGSLIIFANMSYLPVWFVGPSSWSKNVFGSLGHHVRPFIWGKAHHFTACANVESRGLMDGPNASIIFTFGLRGPSCHNLGPELDICANLECHHRTLCLWGWRARAPQDPNLLPHQMQGTTNVNKPGTWLYMFDLLINVLVGGPEIALLHNST